MKNIAPIKFTRKEYKNKYNIFVLVNNEIKFHSIKNFADKGKPPNNKIKNHTYFTNLGIKTLKPLICCKLLRP
jgi:hypothetical protein